jgi:hypothetical protein
LLLAILVIPVSAWAQAGIAGVVKDSSGAVLPGVTVEASSPVLIEQSRTVVTDGQGVYSIVDLRAGTYSVTFSLPGFTTVKRDGIELVGTATATVDGVLQVGQVQETLTVSTTAALVDVRNVLQEQVLTRTLLDSLPTSKSFTSLAALVPGLTGTATVQDVGGSSGEVYVSLGIHGGRPGISTSTSIASKPKTFSAVVEAVVTRFI